MKTVKKEVGLPLPLLQSIAPDDHTATICPRNPLPAINETDSPIQDE
jgi:hypothetical protein